MSANHRRKTISSALAIAVMFTMAAPAAAPVHAQSVLGGPVTNLMGDASDEALDKLAQPGAFYADKAIRIGLPGSKGKLLSKGLRLGDKLGLTKNITKSLNDAAGLAAKEAKPIFRSAINDLSWKDVPGLVRKKDGGTRYLKESAGDELSDKIRPLVEKALGEVGAFKQLEGLQSKNSLLGAAGLDNDSLTDSVTKQALNGIFKYMGNEEAKLRKNPLKTGKKLLDIVR